jgi:hypothetical protein
MIQRSLTALALAACAYPFCALAQPTATGGYAAIPTYSHTTRADIVSYDWTNSGELLYMTSLDYSDMNVWRATNAAPVNLYTSGNFAGLSLVTIGNYVYFNDSDFNNQYIYKYGPLSGTRAVTQISTTANSALFGHQGDLFITGAQGFRAESHLL